MRHPRGCWQQVMAAASHLSACHIQGCCQLHPQQPSPQENKQIKVRIGIMHSRAGFIPGASSSSLELLQLCAAAGRGRFGLRGSRL